MSLKFYAACLASYNNGVLHGAWIDASQDVDAMQAEINAMLRTSRFPNITVLQEGERVPSAEEWAVHDYEGEWPSAMGEYPGLNAIAAWVEVMEKANDRALSDVAKEIASHFGETSDFSETLATIDGRYVGEGDTLTDWTETFADEIGLLNDMPENLRSYFDYEAYGRDLRLGGDIFTVEAGESVHVFWSR